MVLTVTDCEQCERLEGLAKDLQEQNSELAQERAEADREVRRLRRVETMLRRELLNVRTRNPRQKLIQELAAEWKFQTGHPRALVPLEGKRCQAIAKALELLMTDPEAKLSEAQAAERIRKAFVGAGRFPFVVNKQRSATGSESQRYDDVDTILRDEKQIEKLAALADRQASAPRATPPAPSVELVHWQTVQQANHRAIVKLLEGMFGPPLRAADGLDYWPCPRCRNDPATTLRVSPEWASCSACGLDDRLILRTLAERQS